jgi:hypothetical protein
MVAVRRTATLLVPSFSDCSSAKFSAANSRRGTAVAYSRPTGLYEYMNLSGTSLVFIGNVDNGAALVQTLNQSGSSGSTRRD